MRYALLFLTLVLVCGCGQPSLLITPVQNARTLEETTLTPGKGFSSGKIALIEVEGMMMDIKLPSLMGEQESQLSLFDQQLNAAANDPNVKAVVLRINSPGGTVTSSDTMYELVRRFRKKSGKPVVADVQEMAASGGYYVACASDCIVVHPTSVVGSIGVIFQTFNLQGTMQLIGVRPETLKRGTLKDMASPFRPLDDESRRVMQDMIDEFYERFVDVVKTNRRLTDEKTIRLVTDGRVFSGAMAVKYGLADRTGLLEDAIDVARNVTKQPNAGVIAYRRPYEFTGSVYSHSKDLRPQTNLVNIDVPAAMKVPTGFYYLWQP